MRILITGAAQGIGEAITNSLALPDNELIVADLKLDLLQELETRLSGKCRSLKLFAGDLTQNEMREGMVSEVLKNYGGLDVLINNAGVTHSMQDIEAISEEDFDFNFRVNVKLPFQLIKAFLPRMKEQGKGWIINMSSAANIDGYERLSVYAATKAALSSLTDSVAQETAEWPAIKAIAIMPSRTNTPMQVAVRGEQVAEASQAPSVIGELVAQILSGQIAVNSGDNVRVRDGRHIVEARISTQQF